MGYIGPQVWPGGWKVVSREEADLLVSLGADVRAWYTGTKLLDGKLRLWTVAPWRYRHRRAAKYPTCFFVRDTDGQTTVD